MRPMKSRTRKEKLSADSNWVFSGKISKITWGHVEMERCHIPKHFSFENSLKRGWRLQKTEQHSTVVALKNPVPGFFFLSWSWTWPSFVLRSIPNTLFAHSHWVSTIFKKLKMSQELFHSYFFFVRSDYLMSLQQHVWWISPRWNSLEIFKDGHTRYLLIFSCMRNTLTVMKNHLTFCCF